VKARTDSIADLMAKFDPNDPRTGKNYMWATYKPGRRGSAGFKMHMGRGLPTLREIGLCSQCRSASGGRFAQMNRAQVDKRFFANPAPV
jgi:hypothetical protein